MKWKKKSLHVFSKWKISLFSKWKISFFSWHMYTYSTSRSIPAWCADFVLMKDTRGGDLDNECSCDSDAALRDALLLSCAPLALVPRLPTLCCEGFLAGLRLLWPAQNLGYTGCCFLRSGEGLLCRAICCCSFLFLKSRWANCMAIAIRSLDNAWKWKPSTSEMSVLPLTTGLLAWTGATGSPCPDDAARSMVTGPGRLNWVAKLRVERGTCRLNCSWFWNISSWAWGAAMLAEDYW
jgi:hypothetical protein